MTKCPLPVTIIASIYIAAGVVGLAYHLPDFKTQHPFQYDVIGVALLRLLAILGGAFMLRGKNWARWLAIAWIAFHVAIGALHSMQQLLMHLLLFAVFAYFLFRPTATEYFRRKETEVA
jgi:hypothetical protein